MAAPTLLAVDPGPHESAWVRWNGAIVDCAISDNNDLVRFPYSTVDHCAIEMIASYGMAVGKSVFETCIWIGRFYQEWGGADLIPRSTVKMHLCQSMRAKDSNIRQALIDRLGPPGTKKNPGPTHGVKADIWQALALAVTWWDQHENVSGWPRNSSPASLAES